MEDPTKQLGGEQTSAAGQTETAAEQPAAAALTPEERARRRHQQRFYAKLILLGALVIYVVAFVIANTGKVKVDFLVHKAHLSVIWLILLCLAIGLVSGLLVSRLGRRRQRKDEPGDGGRGRGKRDR